MTDLEKGLKINDTTFETMSQPSGVNAISPSGTPDEDAGYGYRPGLLNTPERHRIFQEKKEETSQGKEESSGNGELSDRMLPSEHSQVGPGNTSTRINRRQPKALPRDQLSLGPDPVSAVDVLVAAPQPETLSSQHSGSHTSSSQPSGSNTFHATALTDKDAFEDLEFVYRYNLLYWRARLFKYSQLKDVYSSWPDTCIIENMDKDLERYSRAMDMYRCFKTKPGDLRNNANVRNMGMKMLEYDMANSKPDGDSNDAGAKENHKLAKQTLELQNYFQENVMKIGRTGVTAERQADRGAKFVRNMMMALIGGNALIVPMLIMTLHSTRLTALLTTTLFVFAVAAFLAVYMKEGDPMQIISITAAYAAVLVVFVGTSTTPSW